jgi:hypothetical protein
VTSGELRFKLDALTQSVDSLVTVAAVMDSEVPVYSVGGLALAVASIGEQVTNRGLEVHAVAASLRPEGHAAAGLVSPEVVRYVHALISTGREPGREVGSWP